jgi:two-component system nitrate/nitrite response regulator NarL
MTQEDRPGSEKVRVLIAHESRVVREGIASLLLRSPHVTVIEPPQQETTHKEGQEGSTADIVLLISESTASLPADKIQGIKYAHPDAKVVVIGVSGTENESLEYIEAGASGYILPGSFLEHVIETIQNVHRGEASCPPNILAVLFERIASLHSRLQIIQDNEVSSLTTRELEVLQLITNGMSNKEIATYLKLELQTVKNHVHAILEKLCVRNRREAVACTRRLGLAVGRD